MCALSIPCWVILCTIERAIMATDLSLASIASQTAADLIQAKAHDDKAAAMRESANGRIAQLHKAKANVGRKGKCAIATAFYDALVAGGWAKGTAANYLSVFRDAVETGKPVTDWNPNRDKGAKGDKGKGGKGKGKASLSDLLVKVFNHDDGKSFKTLCEKIHQDFDDANIESVYDGFVEYLKSEGFEIA